MQEDHYYPFGMNMHGLSSSASLMKPNIYKYNAGTELTADFGWQMYDTPHRSYDAQLGRFHQIDPLADRAPGINPYRYGFNNPLLFNDPTGLYESMQEIWNEAWTRADDNGITSWNVGDDRLARNWGLENSWEEFIEDFMNNDGTAEYVQDGGGGFWIDYGKQQSFSYSQKRIPGGVAMVARHEHKKSRFFSLNSFRQSGKSIPFYSDQNFWSSADNYGDFLSAFQGIPALAGGIAQSEIVGDAATNAAKAFNTAYSSSYQNVLRYNKALGATGKILGITGVITSGGQLLTEDFSWTNLTNFGINVVTLALKANPIGLAVSLGVGILDYTGYLDQGLNYIYNEGRYARN